MKPRRVTRKRLAETVRAAAIYAHEMRGRSGEGSRGYPASYIYEQRRKIEAMARELEETEPR